MTQQKPPGGYLEDPYASQTYGNADSWYQLVGPLYHAADNTPEVFRLGFFSERRYISSMNRVHGGMMSSFMDYLLYGTARAAWGDAALATVALNIQFVGVCPPEVWVEGTGSVIRAGRRTAFVRGEARTGDTMIVHATGTFNKLEPRPDRA